MEERQHVCSAVHGCSARAPIYLFIYYCGTPLNYSLSDLNAPSRAGARWGDESHPLCKVKVKVTILSLHLLSSSQEKSK